MSSATDFTTHRRMKVDGLNLNPETGAIIAADHDGVTPQIVNVIFGTGSPPNPSSVPEGTLWIKYLP